MTSHGLFSRLGLCTSQNENLDQTIVQQERKNPIQTSTLCHIHLYSHNAF